MYVWVDIGVRHYIALKWLNIYSRGQHLLTGILGTYNNNTYQPIHIILYNNNIIINQ